MKKAILFLFVLSLSLNAFSQRPANVGGIPQTSLEPSPQDIARQKREMEERKDDYIKNFISTLEGDDFQKEIVKQTLNSYFDKKIALLNVPYERSIDRENVIKNLDKTHFVDLKELISEDDMTKITEMIAGNFDEGEVQKKKRKRKKKDKS